MIFFFERLRLQPKLKSALGLLNNLKKSGDLTTCLNFISSPHDLSLKRVLRRESRTFDSDSPFFPLKSYVLCPHSDTKTAQNVMMSPRPSQILEHPWISIPSPRPRRVLDRETRPFESETRDSGKFWSLASYWKMEHGSLNKFFYLSEGISECSKITPQFARNFWASQKYEAKIPTHRLQLIFLNINLITVILKKKNVLLLPLN